MLTSSIADRMSWGAATCVLSYNDSVRVATDKISPGLTIIVGGD
jgi:hypothetical protein